MERSAVIHPMPPANACPSTAPIRLQWTRHASYETARHETRVIYLFEWHGKPFYWGVADSCRFGVRYNPGYRHLIEGALRHGASLYCATVTSSADVSLTAVENQLIVTCGHVMNSRMNTQAASLDLKHEGALPACLHDIVASATGAAGDLPPCADAPRRTVDFALSADALVMRLGQDGTHVARVKANTVLAVLDAISCRFGGETFCLDDDVERSPYAEIGFGSVVRDAPVENAPLVSGPLARVLADCGVLERTGGTPVRSKPARYRLLQRPASWIELREILERHGVVDDDDSSIQTPITQQIAD